MSVESLDSQAIKRINSEIWLVSPRYSRSPSPRVLARRLCDLAESRPN